jgi:predicted transcriptional regulator
MPRVDVLTDLEAEALEALARAQRMLGITSLYGLSRRLKRDPTLVSGALAGLRSKGLADRPEVDRSIGETFEWRLTRAGWRIAGDMPPWA